MKLDSKYFDSIRIRPRQETPRTTSAASSANACQWKGCSEPGEHRAPLGRGRDGEYVRLCYEHVRQFNANYNYFSGMSDAEIGAFQKEAVTGHRPTWRMGSGIPNSAAAARFARFRGQKAADPFRVFADAGQTSANGEPPRTRPLRTLERKALRALHLGETATRTDIKTRFKELVKRHHPDANGGDRGSEERLREVIQAYNYLKQAGLA